ncbi:MAG TPA: hypothetical protein VJN21_13540 [Candidatus Acidoferrales bacterium]|nr:hypothetical protein [Candidatus Acidoferrales bacterium]
MLQSLANDYWAHPVAVTAAIVAVILILVWMTGSGSRQRFITLKRTKETEQISRDLSRIASSLERIAKSYEMPPDYVGRPIPPGYEDTIVKNHANAEDAAAASDSPEATRAAEAAASEKSANPLGGTASLLGDKKRLNIPNPLYRPK